MLVLLLACHPPPFDVVDAGEVGVVPRSDAIVGRDGGTSALAWGRTVWAYGDTVLAENDATGTNWHTNSWESADPTSWQDGFDVPEDGGAPAFLVPLTDDERAEGGWALWPSEPLWDEDRQRAWILFGRYHDGETGGIGVAEWDAFDDVPVRKDVGGGLLFPEPETEWANAPTVDDGDLYAFGCPQRGLGRPCGLARVPLDAVDQRDAWTFWDGDGWSSDSDDVAKLFEGAPIMSVTWDEALDAWLLVYAPTFSGKVVARTAPDLTGPWSDEVKLFDADGDAPYDAVVHGELAEDGGRTQWITYSRPTSGWFGSEHALWRVELEP